MVTGGEWCAFMGAVTGPIIPEGAKVSACLVLDSGLHYFWTFLPNFIFIGQAGLFSDGTVHGGFVLLHQVAIKKCLTDMATGQSDWGSFSSWSSLFPSDSKCMSNCSLKLWQAWEDGLAVVGTSSGLLLEVGQDDGTPGVRRRNVVQYCGWRRSG